MNPFPSPSKDPLHGLTLEAILNRLVAEIGWEEMARAVDIRCFKFDPSVKSSLQFLRRTPWARAKTEALFIRRCPQAARRAGVPPAGPPPST
jgi:uncharacterized protein (DUF2132 family)